MISEWNTTQLQRFKPMFEERDFWQWFEKHEMQFRSFDGLSATEIDVLMDQFLDALHLYCSHLYFMIGGDPGTEIRELIITAEGNQNYFSKVETLVKRAPTFPRWKIIAFKPVVTEHFTTTYGNAFVDPKKMYFEPLKRIGSAIVGLNIFIDGFEESLKDDFTNATHVVLDNILGEKAYALEVELVSVSALNESIQKKHVAVIRLPAYLAWLKKKA